MSELELTFRAFGLECIGQCAFQLVAVGCALASFHQALEVVVQQAIRLQDLVQVDTIVLGGICGLLSADHSEDNTNDDD